ncbi:MAG: hypothetical protein IJF90_11290 [Synergistaceae bacterium]|nr:hypothetical protein [Synergistaceae bacterium]
MKKYAVMVLAVMLMGVMASGAWARLPLLTKVYAEKCYVGGEARTLASATYITDGRYDTFTFSYEGAMPPGCELRDLGIGGSEIRGIPTMEGVYTITINMQARGTGYGGTRLVDSGSAIITLIIRPAPNDNEQDDSKQDDDNNVSKDVPVPAPNTDPSKDIPVPTPDPSGDIPAPNPAPKPEAINVIAEKLGLTSDEVNYIASSDMTARQNPTASITNAVDAEGYEIVSTQGSINVEKSGTYAFRLTVPADLVGTETSVKAYLANRSIFNGASVSSSALPAGVVEAEIFTTSGGSVTVLPEVILAAANLQADTATTFSTHIAKASSSGNGTNNGGNTGGNTGNNTGGNTNNNGQTNNETPEAVSGSSGGGGCNSGLAILALTALITLRKSRS